MKINFMPQRLKNNLVMEKFIENGQALKRIIEIPGKNPKVLDITYRKTDYLPTEWYVSSYNLIRRDKNSTLEKTLYSIKMFPNEQHTVVQKLKSNKAEKIIINQTNGEVNKFVQNIDHIK